MKPEKTIFKLKPIYDQKNVRFVHAAAKEIRSGKQVRLDYDSLVIAPGPLLNFAGTPGLGPENGFTHSICSLPHAFKTRDAYLALCERMTEMVAACIASLGDNLWDGNAVTILMRPVVPDRKTYQNEYGRDLFISGLEMGLSGAWMKSMLHHTFIWKFKGLFGWKLIPE